MTDTENLNRLLIWLLEERGVSMVLPEDTTQKRQLLRSLMNTRSPAPLPEYVLAWQDRELMAQRALRGDINWRAIPLSPICSRLRLWQGDITRLCVDAIVNAANSQMLGCFIPLHNCIDNAIHSSAGMQLRQECYNLMVEQGHDEEPGNAKLTRGYNLPAHFVIHTVGPIVTGSEPSAEDERQLASCYRSSLIAAENANLATIAFCCISTGVFRYPAKQAAAVAVSTLLNYFNNYPQSGIKAVIIDVFKNTDLEIYRELLGYGQ